ncbi:MAG: cupredoxin domain-containing protein [Thaumarchaeota archaeon]|nr:cupredoxin domain-containing protein [Nitrososphaerota archaeon]
MENSRLVLSHRHRAVGKAVIGAVVMAVVIVAVAGIYFATTSTTTLASTSTTSIKSGGPSAVLISIYSGASNSANAPGYKPDSLTLIIGVNNTVTWTNDDSAMHTVTSTSAPSGASFDSGGIRSGATYTHTFTVPGTYEYHCRPHGWMTGTMVVKAGL